MVEQDPGAEELREAGHGGRARPERQRPEQRQQVAAAADEQGDRGSEQQVLAELQRADEVRRRRVCGRAVVAVEHADADPDEEKGACEPERAAGPERAEPVPKAGRERREDGGEHGEVGEVRRDGRMSERDVDRRLVRAVEEEDRHGRGEDEGPAGGGARHVEEAGAPAAGWSARVGVSGRQTAAHYTGFG